MKERRIGLFRQTKRGLQVNDMSSVDVTIPRIPSVRFTEKRYEENYWDVLGLVKGSYTESQYIKAIQKYAVGYTEGHKLPIRPSIYQMAVMYEINGEKLWFHCGVYQFLRAFEKKSIQTVG